VRASPASLVAVYVHYSDDGEVAYAAGSAMVRTALKYVLFTFMLHFTRLPRVEAGKNTSTVIPASRKRRQEGNPVVSGETVLAGLRKV
jgi:hypothetical protein